MTLELLRQIEQQLNKERNKILHQLNLKYMHYINSLLQQKLLISRKINDQYDEQMNVLQNLISYAINQKCEQRLNVVHDLLFTLYDNNNDITSAEPSKYSESLPNKSQSTITTINTAEPCASPIKTEHMDTSNDFESMLPPLFQTEIASSESFVAHMSLEQASQLSINDKIDHRDFVGRSIPSVIVDKNDTNVQIHYIGWDTQWDVWSDFQNELYKFAKYESISKRQKHRFSSLKIGDYIDIKPVNAPHTKHNMWKIGEVVEFDPHSAQIKIVYLVDIYYQYQWSHLDNTDEIQPLQSQQSLDKPHITHEEIVENNMEKQNKSKAVQDYQCVYCPSCFDMYSQLRDHLQSVHSKKGYICSYCPVVLALEYSVSIHELQHTEQNRTFKCDICDDLYDCNTCFTNKGALTYHKSKVHPDIGKNQRSDYYCMYCEELDAFRGDAQLRKHLKTVHSEKSFICGKCPVAFYRKHSLTNHMQQHKQDGDYECDLCAQLFKCKTTFGDAYVLKDHKKQLHRIDMMVTKENKRGRKRIGCPTPANMPKKKKCKSISKVAKQARDAKNKKRVLNGKIWKLWKRKHEEIRAEFAHQLNKTGLNLRLKQEIKKFILENELCAESDWQSNWEKRNFVMTEALLFDLCVKNLLKKDGIQCDECNILYLLDDTELTQKTMRKLARTNYKMQWKCSNCTE